MGIDAMGFTLALLAVGMTMVAVRQRNILLYVGTSALWATLVAFILANTVAGTNWQSLFILAAFAFMLAMILLTAVSRKGNVRAGNSGNRTGDIIGRSEEEEIAGNPLGIGYRGMMDLSEDEYRALVRSRLRPRTRRQ